jgi:GMP synthase-like glutamine amidotransferase
MLHIVQNDPEVPSGNITGNLPLPHRLLHPYRGEQLPPAGEISALIVLGGAMGANDDHKHPFLAGVRQLISDIVTTGIPYLGICLGGQLLAATLGAKVTANRWEELGTLSVKLTNDGKADQLFDGIPGEFTTFQWHHDSFDLPEGAILLASSPQCPHQAFRFGKCAWGLQFHPEVTEQIIRDWSAWDAATTARQEGLIADFNASSGEYNATARQLLHNFLRAASLLTATGA